MCGHPGPHAADDAVAPAALQARSGGRIRAVDLQRTSSWAWAIDRHLPTGADAWRSGMTLSASHSLRVGRGMFPMGVSPANGHHRRMATEQPQATQTPACCDGARPTA